MPSFTMLRAFEAAARHQSMSDAASELNVTHGAISRQVAALEAFFGRALFQRRSRGVELTESGRLLFHGISAGLDRIHLAIDHFERECRNSRGVTITTLPSFASRWLVPRLQTFQTAHPEVDVTVRSETALSDLADAGLDFGVRYGRGSWPSTEAHRLLSVNAFPLCSPSFISKYGPVSSPEEMLKLPLIHNVTKEWWVDWFVAAGVRVSKLPGGIVVDEYGLALQFAQEGHGIVLGRDVLVQPELAAGTLVRLFDISVAPHFAYYLVRDVRRNPTAEAKLLFEWLLSNHRSAEEKG